MQPCDDSRVFAFCFKCSPAPVLYTNIYFKVFVFSSDVIGTYHLVVVVSSYKFLRLVFIDFYDNRVKIDTRAVR